MRRFGSNSSDLVARVTIIIVLCALYGFVFGLGIATRSGWFLLLSFPFLIGLFFVVRYFIESLEVPIKGLKGEYKVSTILHQMWHEDVRSVDDLVLKSDHGNVDHVAVAKNGVWVIETKYIDGEIMMVNGVLVKNSVPFTQDFIRQVYGEFYAVKELLAKNGFGQVPVRPLLAFVGPFSKVRFGQKPVEGVTIVGSLGLRKVILDKTYGEYLTLGQIENISNLLKKYENDDV